MTKLRLGSWETREPGGWGQGRDATLPSTSSTHTDTLSHLSLVPRPSPALVFDHFQHAKKWAFWLSFCTLQAIKNQSRLVHFLHTASDQKPEPGKAWERGYSHLTWTLHCWSWEGVRQRVHSSHPSQTPCVGETWHQCRRIPAHMVTNNTNPRV